MRCFVTPSSLVLALFAISPLSHPALQAQSEPSRLRFAVTFPAARSTAPIDGRL